jgi:uncharacterized membrane protein YqaE (UPF0057 family)
MKSKWLHLVIAISLGGLFFSCATSNDVAGKYGIQKRKYSNGFYVSKKGDLTNDGQKESTDKVAMADHQKTVDQEINAVYANEKTEIPSTLLADHNDQVFSSNLLTASIDDDVNMAAEISAEEQVARPTISREAVKELKLDKKSVKKQVKEAVKAKISKKEASDDEILYYILAVIIPFLAVGLVTDWDIGQVILNIILCCLCGIPGIIHALIVVSKNV